MGEAKSISAATAKSQETQVFLTPQGARLVLNAVLIYPITGVVEIGFSEN